jgi:uncharacterized protein YkwD
MPARSRRLLAGLVLVTALVAGSAPMDSASAAPRRISEDQQTVRELVNDTRGNNGLRGLAIDGGFSDKATNWARELVRCQCLKHRAGPYGAAPGWCAAAENVGRGYSLSQIHQAFLGSPPHKANILTARMTTIGVGVATDANGEIFVVQAFQDRTC